MYSKALRPHLTTFFNLILRKLRNTLLKKIRNLEKYIIFIRMTLFLHEIIVLHSLFQMTFSNLKNDNIYTFTQSFFIFIE